MSKQITSIAQLRLENMRVLKSQMIDRLCACDPFDTAKIASIRNHLFGINITIKKLEKEVLAENDNRLREECGLVP